MYIKMKKTFVVIVTLLLLPIASAQQQDPGVTPDSFLWGMDKALDQLALLLTFDEGKKAKKGLEKARERLLEVKAMVEENKLDAAAKAEEAHGKTLVKIKQNVKDIKEDDSTEEIKKIIEIEKGLDEHDEEIEQTFGELKVKIEVKGKITQQQKDLIDSILNSLQGQTGEVEIEIKNKKNKTKIKIKQETGRDGEEVEKEIKEEIGLSGYEKEHAEEMREKAESKWDDVADKAGKYNVSVPDKSAFDELIAKGDEAFAQEMYEEAKDHYEAAKDHAEELKDEIEEGGVVIEAEKLEEKEIEIKIKKGKTKVNIEIGEAELEFELDTIALDEIIDEIAARTGLSEEKINDAMEVEVEEEVECVVDSDCNEGEFCDESKCEELEEEAEEEKELECSIDTDCGEGKVCIEGECEKAEEQECIIDADCKEDEICVESKCEEIEEENE